MVKRMLSEAELQVAVRTAQGGDSDAFARIYDHFFDSLYRFCAFRLPSGVAEDVTADIFVKAWEKLGTYQERAGVPFGAWLFRIARHRVVDELRRQKNFEEVPEEVEDEDRLNRAEARVKQQHLLSTMRNAMNRLPRRYQEVLHLSYMSDLGNQEVAQVLRTSEGSVRILKFRALKKLQEYLPPDSQDSA